MAQQTINIGTSPDDGTGDQLRTCFGKANDNFTELYAAIVGLQPLNSDLTAIAALTTTAFGRGLLELANAAALRTAAGLVIGTDVQAHAARLDNLAATAPAANGTFASPTSITIVNGLITAIS